jgi:Protein of unknown function (DUF3085)
VAHSLAAPAQSEHVIDYRKGKAITALPEAPAVLLVHDEGVYLMSNGFPADPLERKATGRHFRRYVAYAQGCDPRTDKGWYETAHDLVGGDDFGECLPWAAPIKRHIEAGAQHIIIEVKADSLELMPSGERADAGNPRANLYGLRQGLGTW